MREVAFPALGDNADTLAGFDSWLERLCWHKVKLMEDMSAAGFKISSHDLTDITAAQDAFTGMSDQFVAYLDSVEAASIAGDDLPAFDPSIIPDLVQFVGLAVTGQWGLVFVLFVKVGISYLAQRATSSQSTGGADVEELTEVLRKFGLDTNANGDEYSLLWALARQQIRIMVQGTGGFDEAIVDDVST